MNLYWMYFWHHESAPSGGYHIPQGGKVSQGTLHETSSVRFGEPTLDMRKARAEFKKLSTR